MKKFFYVLWFFTILFSLSACTDEIIEKQISDLQSNLQSINHEIDNKRAELREELKEIEDLEGTAEKLEEQIDELKSSTGIRGLWKIGWVRTLVYTIIVIIGLFFGVIITTG